MKKIENSKAIRSKIIAAVDKIAEPVIQTLSPKGKNVLFEDAQGGIYVTNDGVTIAKQIESEDPIEDAVIRVIKYASLETNRGAGDGTTTTCLLAQKLIKEGFKKLDNGMNEMDLRDELSDFADKTIQLLDKRVATTDDELLNIANISANNDAEIANNVLKVVKAAGETGMVFINPSSNGKTEVIEDIGYVLNSGMLTPELANESGKAAYENVHVFVTDKRLYYEEECHSILSAAIENGIRNLVIVARDFIGKAPNFLIANHVNGYINLLLVKMPDVSEKDNTSAYDLTTYLGGELVTERAGKIVGNVSVEDFIVASKVYSTRERTVFQSANTQNEKLVSLIAAVTKQKEDEPDNKDVERRLSSLTKGVVTVNVGGATPIETQERIFRYEDAVNATRAAMKDGYLVGGGLALYAATRQFSDPAYRRVGEASIRQIATNCGQFDDHIVSQVSGNVGYNAKTGSFEDLLVAGVIDPYKVTESAIRNAVSIATAILTSGFIIVNEKENDTKK